MKPKIKGHPKRHKYDVGQFTLRGEPVDVHEQQIIHPAVAPNDINPSPTPVTAPQPDESLEAT
jgi:hypothetical protein